MVINPSVSGGGGGEVNLKFYAQTGSLSPLQTRAGPPQYYFSIPVPDDVNAVLFFWEDDTQSSGLYEWTGSGWERTYGNFSLNYSSNDFTHSQIDFFSADGEQHLLYCYVNSVEIPL